MSSTAEVTPEKKTNLVHRDLEVTSHVQRFNGDYMLNILMMDGYDCPFKYCRKNKYKSLKGKHVDLSYYPAMEVVAGFEVDVMEVVQIKVL